MRTDILLDDNFDLIDNGDEWAEGDSDDQHGVLLTITEKCEFKEFPFVGFGIQRRLKGVADRKRFIRELKVELESDGYENTDLIVNSVLSEFKAEI